MRLSAADQRVEAFSASLAASLDRRKFLGRGLTLVGAASIWVTGLDRGAYAHHNEYVHSNCGSLNYASDCNNGCGPSPQCGHDGTVECCDPDGTHCNLNNCRRRGGECPGGGRCWQWRVSGCGPNNDCTALFTCCDCWTPGDRRCICRRKQLVNC